MLFSKFDQPREVEIPEFELPTKSPKSRQPCMNHVLEHVASIEWNHWNEVGKPEKNVDPHDPEQEVDKEEQAFFPDQVTKP